MSGFSERDRTSMQQVIDELTDMTATAAHELQSTTPDLDGLAIVQRDTWHTTSPAVLVTATADNASDAWRSLHDEHLHRRRLDQTVTGLRDIRYDSLQTLHGTLFDRHRVVASHIPEKIGRHAAAAVLGFFADKPTQSLELPPRATQLLSDLSAGITPHLQELDSLVSQHPTYSIGDALHLDVPSVPNAFVTSWDISASTQQAYANYPALRDHLLRTRTAYQRIATKHQGKLVDAAGDSGVLSFEIPYPAYDRASAQSLRKFGRHAVLPALAALIDATPSTYHTRFVTELGRIERGIDKMTGPVFWRLNELSYNAPRDQQVVTFGPAASHCLGLTSKDIDDLHNY